MGKRKVLSDSIVLTIGNYVVKLRGLLFMPVIIKAMGLASYGIFIQLTTNLSMIHPFCTLALGEGFRRYSSKYEKGQVEELSEDYWTVIIPSIFTSFIGALLIFLLAPIICESLFQEVSSDVLLACRISSLMVIERVLWEQMNNYLMARKRFKQNTYLSLAYKFVPYMGLVAGFMFWRSMAWGMGLFLFFESIFVAVLFFMLMRELPVKLVNWGTLKKFFSYSWTLTVNQFEGGLLAKLDRYFISVMMGPAAVGAYNIVYSVVSFLDDVSIPFRRYYSSYLPKMWDNGNEKKALKQIRTGLRYYFIISWMMLIAIVLVLPQLLELLLSERAPDIENFNWLVLVTGCGIVAEGGRRLYGQIISLRNLNHYRIMFNLIAVVVNLILNYFLIPTWGLVGAGFATLVSYWIILVLNARMFSIEAGSKFYVQIFLAASVGIPAILVAQSYPAPNIYYAVGYSILFVTLFLLAAFNLRLTTMKELKQFLSR